MAPRGRARRPRLSRMDAAIDAMIPLGFSGELVRRTVKNLLEEYGGDEGWPFIEADAYRVLLDTILGEQDNNPEGGNLLKDDSLHDDAGDHAVLATAGPSGGVVEAIGSEISITVSQTDNTGREDCHLPAKRDGQGWKDIDLDQTCNPPGMVNATGNTDVCSGGAVHLHDSPVHLTPPPVILSQPPVDVIPTRRRKPCYGWISSDDEEEDFIQLTPAKPWKHLEKLIGGTDKRIKRKTRWDVQPENT